MGLKKTLMQRNRGYTYGHENLANNDFSLVDKGESYKIKGFYSGVGKSGVCNEQHLNFFKENSDLNLVKVVGTEPKYFNVLGNHYFLLGFEEDMLPDLRNLNTLEQLDLIKEVNPYVVDVSFGEIERLGRSGYRVRDALIKFPKIKDAYFSKEESKLKPLGVLDNRLISLGTIKDEFYVFSKKRRSIRDKLIGTLEKVALSSEFSGSELHKIVNNLNKAKNVLSK